MRTTEVGEALVWLQLMMAKRGEEARGGRQGAAGSQRRRYAGGTVGQGRRPRSRRTKPGNDPDCSRLDEQRIHRCVAGLD